MRLAVVLLLVAVAGVGAGCGGSSALRGGPAPRVGPRLALGLSEQNPALIAPGRVSGEFAAWRDRVAALRPTYYRLFVDWSKLDDRLDAAQDGCLRGLPPCAAYAGVRAQLDALAARRRATPGRWEPLVVIYGVPARFARAAGGCERSDAAARSRSITDAGIVAYRGLIRRLLAEGAAAGVPLRWWSPWNEPNHPAFISPQRADCDASSPSLAPAVYTRLAEAMRGELDAAGGHHDLLLGELAGHVEPTPRSSSVAELVAGLPDHLACAASAWSVHDYGQPDGRSPDAVAAMERALDARACTRGKPVWVTETGAGGTRPGADRPHGAVSSERACLAEAARLTRWDADPRVQAAFQYSFRDDPAYPVGLADARLTHVFPAYRLWLSWATAAAAPSPTACLRRAAGPS